MNIKDVSDSSSVEFNLSIFQFNLIKFNWVGLGWFNFFYQVVH